MDFTLSEEARAMATAVADLLADHCPSKALRALLARGESFDAGRWARLVAMGLPGALLPEAVGGLGLAGTAFAPIAEACGAALLPEPLVETAWVTLPLLVEAGAGEFVARVLAGEATVAIVHPLAPLALAARQAAAIVLVEEDRILLAPAATARLTPRRSIDPFRDLALVAAGAGTATLAAGAAARAMAGRAAARGALAAAAQMLGLGRRALDLAVAFARTREQFGRPIGSYQAVKHHLASAAVAIELARPVVHAAAALAPGAGPATAARIAHAKLAAGRAAEGAARAAIQVHGAMGHSWEVDVHLILKRTLALATTWGTAADLRATAAAHLLAALPGPAALFPEESADG
ncbi:MAG: acyl-CoA dehydrogenase family protein [Rhodobacteraceae bacterium]|nr:acyl-CoA dehydrogenase family protein [Paracoccaceae bacterium]